MRMHARTSFVNSQNIMYDEWRKFTHVTSRVWPHQYFIIVFTLEDSIIYGPNKISFPGFPQSFYSHDEKIPVSSFPQR